MDTGMLGGWKLVAAALLFLAGYLGGAGEERLRSRIGIGERRASRRPGPGQRAEADFY
jgi:hypothetical protein